MEAILEAASQILRRDGLEGAGTAAIAKRAGVSVGTLYQYFPNKEAVFDELIDRVLDQRAADRSQILQGALASDELGPAIVALIDALMALHAADPSLHHQLLRHEAASGQNRLQRYEEGMRALVASRLLAHADKTRPLDAPLAARVLVHAVMGVAERMAREDPALLGRAEVRREIAILVAGYLSPGNPVLGLG